MKHILSAVILLTLVGSTGAEDWPRWRGPRGDGTWHGPALPEKWPEAAPRTVWRQPIGGGYAGITVANGRVFTLDLEKPVVSLMKGDTGPDATERVRCFDAATGKPLWSHAYPVRYGSLGGYANGPRAAPTVHDGKLYTLGAVGHLFCFEAATGKVVWQRDTVKDLAARVPMWGFAAAPVVDGDRVLVPLGAEPQGAIITFDRQSGKEVWRALSDEAAYCPPVLIDPPTGRQLVVWTPSHVHGLDPSSGRSIWKVPHKVNYGVSIATPIYRDGMLFVTEYWEGTLAIRPGKTAEVAWRDRKLRGLMAQPLYRGGHVYSFDREEGLTCVELRTGKRLWSDGNQLTPKARNPHASIVWLGHSDRVLALNSEGELVLARLTPAGYDEESRVKVLEGRVWSHPGFSGRFLFARTDGGERWQKAGPHELVCVELVPLGQGAKVPR